MDPSVRRRVRDRADGRCEYGGLAEEDSYIPHHIEHIRPKQHGGSGSLSNLALACQACNLKKGPNLAGIDPQSETMVALFNPRQQSWEEHFIHRGDFIMGLTPTGRATVQVLDMNARERVKIRQDLR
jgi:hypothetical protein